MGRAGNLWKLAGAVAVATGLLHVLENYVYLQTLLRLPDRGLAATAALQTENGFYYSYYSELVEADSALEGLQNIIWDRRTEYPDVLNAIRRFNIYQEVVVALEFRALRFIGVLLPHPFDFFRAHILALSGVGQAAMSMLASEISGNPLAGLACFLASFLCRFQISRLGNYTSSNLRELWGTPVLWVQCYLLWRLILCSRQGRQTGGRLLWFGFTATTFLFIVLWQFSPFMLLLQATALYFVKLVAGYNSLRVLVVGVINSYCVALALAVVVHFGSPYLLTSPFFFQLVALKVSTSVCCCERRRGRGAARWLVGRLADVGEGLIAVLCFVLVRKALENFATADTHVYEILCTKVSAVNDLLPTRLQLSQGQLPDCAEPSFNARLYLMMGVFNLLDWSSLEVYRASSVGLAAGLSCLLVVLRCLTASIWQGGRSLGDQEESKGDSLRPSSKSTASNSSHASGEGLRRRKGGEAAPNSGSGERQQGASSSQEISRAEDEEGEDAALLFFVVQFLLFCILGGLINRLRVALGPPMMVLAACCFGPRLFPARCFLRRFPKIVHGVLGVLFCLHMLWMTSILPCVSSNEGICQHTSDKASSDGDLADLYDWINNEMEPGTPVLASMNLAGSMRAFTHVPMIIHPQFESENLRARVQRAYELYNCGSEESFAQTMRALHAKVVIFEYSRCFFTPYALDDRRKNCNDKKHAPEDLTCLKLHARSRRFKLIFMNGNYAVFRLRETPLPLPAGGKEPRPSDVKAWLDESDTWKEYVNDCARTQGDKCGPRLLEAAASVHHGLKRPAAANSIRNLAMKLYPHNGYVNFYFARYLDYDSENPKKAKAYYDKAMELLPNNPVIFKEVIMFYDIAMQDPAYSASLVEKASKATSKRGQESLLTMTGSGVGSLLCEAAVAAKGIRSGGEELSKKLWARARSMAPLSDCIKNNWPLIYGEPNTYAQQHGMWDKVKLMLAGGVQHEVAPHHLPSVRFMGDVKFDVVPPRNKTVW